ncbi:MAG: SRPBCC family protein [Alphaproteobacteria bacterium]|nr:SRPBCC family protein [Alphaproteobacteria bacterium]
MRALLLLLSLSLAPALAGDAAKPHPHQGKLAAYPVPPKAVALNAAQEAAFRRGEPVYTQMEGGNQGRGAAVFLVDAPPAKVWATIRDFSSYPGWIDGVSECGVYKTEGDHVYARFLLSRMGISVEYFVDHLAPAGADYMTWTLDYSRESDLDDSVGAWRVTALPDDPSKSRVEYSVDLMVSGWVPGFIRDMVVDQGLKDATGWVKVQSEG